MNEADQNESRDPADPGPVAFFEFGLHALGLQLEQGEQGVYTIVPVCPVPANLGQTGPAVHLPEAVRAVVGQQFTSASASTPLPAAQLTTDTHLFRWLLARLAERDSPIQAEPVRQPVSVHELTPALFRPYRIDAGQVHLAGCRLEDRPLLRLTCLGPSRGSPPPELIHCYADTDGSPLAPDLVQQLGLDQLQLLSGRVPRLGPGVIAQWAEVARREWSAASPVSPSEHVLTTVVWCKFVEGKLAFTIDSHTAELAFSGWAQLLSQGTALPPPFTCPWTGEQSYHLAAADDGRVTVVEALEVCQESQRRVLRTELATCAITGQRVLEEYLRRCPVSDERVLARLFTACSMCREGVSPRVLVGGKCQTCRSLAPVVGPSPLLEQLSQVFPRLVAGRRWLAAENQGVVVLVGKAWWNRVLVVLDRHSQDVLRVARRSRLSSRWQDISEAERLSWQA